MALIKCPECGKEISDKASSCPNCGYPISNNSFVVSKENQKQTQNNDNENNSDIVQSKSKKSKKIFIIGGITIVAIFIVVFFNPRSMALRTAKGAVKDEIGNPTTVSFSDVKVTNVDDFYAIYMNVSYSGGKYSVICYIGKWNNEIKKISVY